jgi:tetratricopeptide (TPR) repeat protein
MTSVSKRRLWLTSILVILGVLVYSNTLEVPFYFDDLPNIQKNPPVHLTHLTLEGIKRAAFESPASNRPIANISFALNYYFHQEDVRGYHAINIIIHLLNGLLLFLFIEATLSVPSLRSKYKSHPFLAFFVALVWLVHPIQTQSVTYVVQRMNSMAAMFYLLSFLLYVKGRLVGEKKKRWPWFAGCVVAGILALASKEIAATLPFFILLYEWYFFQDLGKAWLKRHLPSIIGSLILFALLGFLYLGSDPLQSVLSGYKHRDYTLIERVLTQCRVVVHYMSLLVYPHPSRLNLDYDFRLSHSLVDPITTLFSIACIMTLLGLALFTAKKERLISFSILWFFGNLAIESSVIGLEVVYEHRTYLPSMFFVLMIVLTAYRYVRKDWAIAAILGAVVILFCVWTYERNTVWGDPVGLWRDCVQKSAGKMRPHFNLGNALVRQHRPEEAIVHYREALRIEPDNVNVLVNLGSTLSREGKINEAVVCYSKALEVEPQSAEAYNGLGVVLAKQGRFDEAIARYREALRIRPNYAEARRNLQIGLAKQGMLERATDGHPQGLPTELEGAEACINQGIVLAGQGKLDEAIAQFSKALQIRPDHAEAHYNLGLALAQQGKFDKAADHYRKALRIKPDYAEVHNNLGIGLARQGKLDEAISHFSEALRIRPDFAQAQNNLERALAIQKKSR